MSNLPDPLEIARWLEVNFSQRKLATVDVIGDLQVEILAAFPQLQGEASRFGLLAEALETLVSWDRIRFSTKKDNAFQYYRQKFLPLKITIKSKRAAPAPRPNIRWHPSLQAAGQVVDNRTLDRLVQINDWLINNPGAKAFAVPAQERSLQIFGSEKVLANLSIALPGGVLIDESFLRFNYVEAHLPYVLPKVRAASTIGLIIENTASFDVFGEWNRLIGDFAVIVSGEGKRVLGSPHRLNDLAKEYGLTEWRYFGDIDPEGLNIGVEANRASLAISGPAVLPLEVAYRWLSRYGEQSRESRKTRDERPLWSKIREDVIAWVNSPLVVERCEETVKHGTLIPQEWLGLTVLREVSTLREIGRHRPILPKA